MRILLACAAGMSTSILVNKMRAYWNEQGEDLSIEAVGAGEVSDVAQNYDIVLIGPQISYRLNEVKEASGLPCAPIPPTDYALHNCANIMALAKKLYEEK